MIKFHGNQKIALESTGNVAISAAPGSGKTTVISEKIRRIIHNSNDYSGVIAVSFTNKASNNLRDKCESGVGNIRNCYFGTIDKFCISEIIHPFGKDLSKSHEFIVLPWEEVAHEDIEGLVVHPNEPLENHNNADSIAKFLKSGIIVLDLATEIATFVYNNSISCKKYLASKYSHIIIDEYQDCNLGQHILFCALIDLGLTGIAAGDIQQSIFKFANKDPKYLVELTHRADFHHVSITENFRSHSSIVDYSSNFRSRVSNYHYKENTSHVISAKIAGDEFSVFKFINKEHGLNHFGQKQKTFGLFFTANDKCLRASNNLHNSSYFPSTPVDEKSSIHCHIFRHVLSSVFSSRPNSYEFALNYFNEESETTMFTYARKFFQTISKDLYNDDTDSCISNLIHFSSRITGVGVDPASESALKITLQDQNHINSYAPIRDGALNIMTYHKAKGLEFDVVIMPELYKYILPNAYRDQEQEANIYYVGITRPKDFLFLITSTIRHKADGASTYASESEFITKNDGQRFLLDYDNYISSYFS
jgi:DNA helicase-2/ATP-dependent DNA helicase PcrA